ncbi:MAG: FecR domain-containing protein [Paludibaculum sp.]
MKRWLLTLIMPGILLSGTAMAQQEGSQQDDDTAEGPGRGVARVSLLNGDVSVRRGDSGDWVAAAINAPLLAEDRVMTGPGARAEVQLDFYNRIRMAPDTEIRLSQLDQGQYQIQVARGLVTFSALKGSDAQIEISTPGAALRPLANGNYRITVNPDGMTEFTVRSGEADIASPRGVQRLRTGRTMQVRGDANDSEYQLVGAIPKDDWDQFNEQRNRDLARTSNNTYQYVSRDVYGAEDLDGYGEWVDVAPYGWSWRPYVAVGWAPYRYGRWGWMDYYGWSWVSYDPWGWAPYHYGRWFYAGGRWCWSPGARGGRHYWSPALVGFVGWNSWGGFNAGVGFGWGAVGWIPLAPFEPVHRWWGRGYYGNYRNPVNFYNRSTYVTNVNITNVYRNSRIENGVTVVNGNDFSRGYAGRPMRAGAAELSRADMARGAVPVAPTRESLRWSDRDVNTSSLQSRTAATNQERFYTRRATTTRVDRVPFETQRQTLEHVASRGVEARANAGRTATAAEPTRGGQNPETRSPAAEGRGWRQTTDSNGSTTRSQGAANEWQRFGDPRMSSHAASETSGGAARTAEPANTRQADHSSQDANRSNNGGWQRFGDPGSRNRSEQSVSRTSDSGGASQGSDSSRQASPRWSTGGGSPSRSDTPRSSDSGGRMSSGSSSRSESPRMETARPSSSGGGGGGGGRSESPRMESPRSAPSSSGDRGGGGGGGSRQASPSRSGGKGNSDSEPMASGNGTSSGSSEASGFTSGTNERASSSFGAGSSNVAGGGSFSGNSGGFGLSSTTRSSVESQGSFSGNSGNFGGGTTRSMSADTNSYSGGSGGFGGGSTRSMSADSSSYSSNSGGFGTGSSRQSAGAPSFSSPRSSGGFSGSSGSIGRSSGGGGGVSRSSGGGGGGRSSGGRGR